MKTHGPPPTHTTGLHQNICLAETQTGMQRYIHMTYIYVYIYIHSYTHAYTHAYPHTYTHTYTHTRSLQQLIGQQAIVITITHGYLYLYLYRHLCRYHLCDPRTCWDDSGEKEAARDADAWAVRGCIFISINNAHIFASIVCSCILANTREKNASFFKIQDGGTGFA